MHPNRFNLASAEPSNVLVSNCTRVCEEFSTQSCQRILATESQIDDSAVCYRANLKIKYKLLKTK